MAPGKLRGRMAMMAGVLVVVAAAFGCQQDGPTDPPLGTRNSIRPGRRWGGLFNRCTGLRSRSPASATLR